ncbi:hypothetical protein HDU96_009521, partial [Phlyctochytrium bullatum]
NRGEPLKGYTKQYFDKDSLEMIPDEVSDSWLLGATLWEFWSNEAFNVEEEIRLDDIRNSIIKDIVKKLLRPRKSLRRPSAKQILSLFEPTTMHMASKKVQALAVSVPQAIQSPRPQNSAIPSVESTAGLVSNASSTLTGPLKEYWDALSIGNTRRLRSILSKRSFDVDTPKDGLTGLQFACRKNLVDVVKTLLEFNADHERKDESGRLPIQLSTSVEVWREFASRMPTPSLDLFAAAENGDDVGARLILAEKSASVVSSLIVPRGDPVTKLKQTRRLNLGEERTTVMPLHVSAHYGHAALCQVFLQAGADIDCRDDCYQTPLILAAFRGHLDVVKLLVESGAKIEGKNKDGWTPLLCALSKGHVEVVRFLVERGADVNTRIKDEDDPLHWAAARGDVELVRFSLERGANINIKNNKAETPLHIAARHGHAPVCEVLLQAGAEVDGRDEGEKTPLIWAAWQGHLSVVQVLVERGANVRASDKYGWTPLHYAAWRGRVDMARFLLDRGADVDGKWERTPLILAASKGHLPVAQVLVERGADVHARDENGNTPLHCAAFNGDVDMARFLLDRGADVNCRDKWERTPLILAAQWGHLNVAQLLVERGALIYARDEDGKTARDIALKYRRKDIAALLAKEDQRQFPSKTR